MAANGSQDGVAVDRPGFPREASIADPAALATGPAAPVVSFGGQPVVQACGVLTVEDLRAAGQQLVANSIGRIVQRLYFDGQGAGELPVERYLLPEYGNNCGYLLRRQPHPGHVRISVFQPGYVPEKLIRSVTDGVPVLREGGRRTGAPLPPRRRAAALPRHGGAARARPQWTVGSQGHPGGHGRGAARRSGGPAGRADAVPVRQPGVAADYGNACELVGADEFRAIFGTEPSPLVNELLPSAVGQVDFGGPDGRFNSVDSSCIRASNPVPGTDRRVLDALVITFEHARAAERQFGFSGRHAEPVDPPVGDEAVYGCSTGWRAR